MALFAFASSILYHPLINAFLLFIGLGLVEEHTLPDSMAVGSSTIASWTIDKGQTAGFARFQLSFPPGIIIEPLKTDGASFTYEDQKAKFIWMDIPTTPSIHISVRLSTRTNFIGGEIKQWFSFIEEGSRRDVEFEPHVISLDRTPATAMQTENSWNPQATRSLTLESEDIGYMELAFSGFEPGSFMKWEEIIPEDCTFEWESNGNPSIMDRFGDTLLLVWQHAPAAPSIQLSYRLSGNMTACAANVHGTWHTIFNNQPHSVVIPSSPLEQLAPSPDDVALQELSNQSKATTTPAVQATTRPDFSVPEPDDGIAYRVQIMACHRDVDQLWFEDHYAFREQVDAERHNNWIKYTTGSHAHYRHARDQRERIARAHAMPGPFVTAYLRNDRITVQEALLLSKQNWMP